MKTDNEIRDAENRLPEIFSQEEITENTPEGEEVLLHTEPQKARMLKALIKSLGIVSYAAGVAGITRKTHYNWLKTDPEYKTAVESVNEVTLDYTEARLFKYLQQSDLKAIMFILRTRGKARGYSAFREREGEIQAAIYNMIVKDQKTADAIMKNKETI